MFTSLASPKYIKVHHICIDAAPVLWPSQACVRVSEYGKFIVVIISTAFYDCVTSVYNISLVIARAGGSVNIIVGRHERRRGWRRLGRRRRAFTS